MKTFITQEGENINFHPGVEIFSFQPEVKGTCISKKSHPGVNLTLPTCNMPLRNFKYVQDLSSIEHSLLVNVRPIVENM